MRKSLASLAGGATLLGFMMMMGAGPTAPPSGGGGGPATANLWVDTNGGTCTRQASPAAYNDAAACSSGPAAYQAASDSGGDLVYVKGGTYSSGWAFAADAGKTGSTDTVIAEAPGETVIVGGSCTGPVHIECITTDDASHLTLRGFETPYFNGTVCGSLDHQGKVGMGRGGTDITFDDIDAGGIFISVSDATVKNSDLGPWAVCNEGPSASDIRQLTGNGDPQTILFENNYVHDVLRTDGSHTECIYANAGDNVTLTRNRFDNCAVITLGFFPGEGCSAVCTPANWSIINNWFFDTLGVTAQMVDLSERGGVGCPGYDVSFNSFRDGNINASTGCAGSSGARIIGNVIPSQTGCIPGGGTWNQDYNIIGSGSGCGANDAVGGTLGFVSTTAPYDLHITSSSAARDKVPVASCLSTDYDSEARPIGSGTHCDAGSDERS